MPRATKPADAGKQPAKKAAAVTKGGAGKSASVTKRAPAGGADDQGVGTPPAPGGSKAAKAQPQDKFLREQRALLEAERATYEEQAAALKEEADQLAEEMEPGDIQFDDESGEGGTVNVDRERDLALSAQARAAVDEINHALAKMANGTYGLCEGCGEPIPKARLKALPHARLCVACKSGGLSRR